VSRGVSALLAAWDPLGVVRGGAPADEYDCLVLPLVRLLHQGASPKEIAAVLGSELASHFGVAQEGGASAEFAERLSKWFLDQGSLGRSR
jgi:hypothetical protein